MRYILADRLLLLLHDLPLFLAQDFLFVTRAETVVDEQGRGKGEIHRKAQVKVVILRDGKKLHTYGNSSSSVRLCIV